MAADPSSALARMNLAASLTRLGDAEAAIGQTRKALELSPDDAAANFGMATLLARSGQDAAALVHYQRALEADPGYQDAHYNLANALRRLERFEEAARHYGQVVSLDPHHANARYGQAVALGRMGRWTEARDLLESGYRLLAAPPVLSHGLSRLLAACPEVALRDGPRALRLAEDLYRKERSLPHVEALAMAQAEMGRFEEALRLQEAALQAVQGSGQPALVEDVRSRLAEYRQGRPSRRPW